MDPPLQQCEQDVDRREEEQQEDRHLYDGTGLHGPQAQRDAGRPEDRREVDEDGQRVEADEIDPTPADVHPHEQRDHRHHRSRDEPADERRRRVAEHDPAAVRRGEEEPAPEAALEVTRDPEAREDAAERSRLEEYEDELEGGVPGRVVESRHLVEA